MLKSGLKVVIFTCYRLIRRTLFVFQVAVVSSSSSHCRFLSLNMFLVSPQAVVFGSRRIKHTSSNGLFAFPHPTLPLSFPYTDPISVDRGLEWGLMAGLWDLPAMGAVFYQGAGWPQWKPLEIPGTHLPLNQGSRLIIYNLHCNKHYIASCKTKN